MEMWRDDDCDNHGDGYCNEENAHELLEDEQADVTVYLSSSIVIISQMLPIVLYLPPTPSSAYVAVYELEPKIIFSNQANYSNRSRIGVAGQNTINYTNLKGVHN
ncbi:hypothetical protein TorRG33x02_271410 [Trema orientale]|uniref:Uncharacterized protein n=1 Tax=Trema orientale TaxID=63057 RepID=A0A2P5CW16_TREOI|nr:hypothetical protein TorRG33x02_271410 [Trema orientale]